MPPAALVGEEFIAADCWDIQALHSVRKTILLIAPSLLKRTATRNASHDFGSAMFPGVPKFRDTDME
jgi:hypothetical protein